MTSDYEEALYMASAALGDAVRGMPRALRLMAVIDEVELWLADDHQADAWSDHWRSLVSDLESALASVGPALREAVVIDGLDEELQAIRIALGGRRGPPDRSLIRRVERATATIAARASEAAARSGAVEDLVAAARTGELALTQQRAGTVVDLGTRTGRSSSDFSDRIQDALRGPIENAVARAKASAAIEAVRDDRVVWLRYRVASLNQDVLRMGARVVLFDGDWLAAELSNAPSPELLGFAPELSDHRTDLESLARRHGDVETGDDRPPFVVIRVELARVRSGEAVDLARQTAGALAG